jgi:hypothetical protein
MGVKRVLGMGAHQARPHVLWCRAVLEDVRACVGRWAAKANSRIQLVVAMVVSSQYQAGAGWRGWEGTRRGGGARLGQ